MFKAEDITFCGSFIDKMSEMRSNGIDLENLIQQKSAYIIKIYDGKPLLVKNAHSYELVGMFLDSSYLKDNKNIIFVGRYNNEKFIFAENITHKEYINSDFENNITSNNGVLNTEYQNNFYDLREIMSELKSHEAEIASIAKSIFYWHSKNLYCSCCGNINAIRNFGWEMQCNKCQTTHFPRVDPVIIAMVTHGQSILLTRSPGWPENVHSLLAGFVEPGETAEGAVRRETLEETDIKVGKVEYLASQPWAFPSSMMFAFKAEALNSEIIIDKTELENALWVTREELVKGQTQDNQTIKMPREGTIARFLLNKWIEEI